MTAPSPESTSFGLEFPRFQAPKALTNAKPASIAQMNLFGLKFPSFQAPDFSNSLPKMEPPDFGKVTIFF